MWSTEENKWSKKTPLLRKSLFPNISPFINFISLREEYEQTFELGIPWWVWRTTSNPLLLSIITRAGFVIRQISSVSYSECVGSIWDTIDSKTRFLMFYMIAKDASISTTLLAKFGQS